MSVFAQRTISGRVADDKGNPLVNVSVTVKGTTTGTTRGIVGTYPITVSDYARSHVLYIYIDDMVPQEVNITSSSFALSISCSAQSKSLLKW